MRKKNSQNLLWFSILLLSLFIINAFANNHLDNKVIINDNILKQDSIEAVELRNDKEWFPRCERIMPLALPKKIVMIRPYLSFDISSDAYERRMNEDESYKSLMADIVLSPTNKLDITVFPYPVIEYAFLNQVAKKGRVLYLNGSSVSIGAGMFNHRRLRNNRYNNRPSFVAYHRYFLKSKILIAEKSWLSLPFHVELMNQKFSNVEFEVNYNLKINKVIYGTLGANYHYNYFHENWETFQDDYKRRLNGIVGVHININRHIRTYSMFGAGKDFANNKFVGIMIFTIRGIW